MGKILSEGQGSIAFLKQGAEKVSWPVRVNSTPPRRPATHPDHYSVTTLEKRHDAGI